MSLAQYTVLDPKLHGFAGDTVVLEYLQGMESVREFVSKVVTSIPDDAGEDGPDGEMKIPRSLQTPMRKRRREDTPPPRGGAGGASGQGAPMSSQQLGFALMAAMEADVGNELLHDLDDYPFLPCDVEDRSVMGVS